MKKIKKNYKIFNLFRIVKINYKILIVNILMLNINKVKFLNKIK